MIRILAIGRRHDAELMMAINGYQKRLKPPYDPQWVLLPHSAMEGDAARSEESRRLLEKLNYDDYVILLDERGKLLDNHQLQGIFQAPLEAARRVVCLIGGAYGVDVAVQQRADVVWSLSPLVFPHQLVRLLLVEQVYRTQALAHGHPYHHA